MALEVAEKLYYRIGEVEELAGVPAYVLRYWESEFKLLRPKKNPAGQRLYRRRDLELVQRIKSLLYDERLTLEGARKRLIASSSASARRPTRTRCVGPASGCRPCAPASRLEASRRFCDTSALRVGA